MCTTLGSASPWPRKHLSLGKASHMLILLCYYKHLLLVTVKGRTLNETGVWLDCHDLSHTIMESQPELLLSLAIYQFVTSPEHYDDKKRGYNSQKNAKLDFMCVIITFCCVRK